MARRSYEQDLVGWALGRLGVAQVPSSPVAPAAPVKKPAKGKAKPAARGGKKVAAAATIEPATPALAPAPDAALERLVTVFELSKAERVALQLACAVERSSVVGRAARLLTGGRGLAAWLVGEIAGEGLLASGGKLRAHGLLVVDTIPGGQPSASDEVRLAPGVARLLAGEPVEPESLGAGVERIGPADRGPLSESLATLVRDDVMGSTARWVAISGITPAEGEKLAAAIARRLARPAIRVDGRLLARLAAADAWSLLAAARRETDLAESTLLVDGAGSLGGLLRAVAVVPRTVARVLLADDRRVPDLAAPSGFAARVLMLDGAGSASVADAAGALRPDGPAVPTQVPASIEAARRQAALDAARAMGRPLDLPPLPAAPVTPAVRAAVAPVEVAAAAPVAPVEVVAPRSAPPPPAPEPTLSREERMRRAEQFVGSATPSRRRSPQETARHAAPEPPPPSPVPVAAVPAAVVAAPASSSAAPGAAPAASAAASPADGGSAASLATGDPSESLPYIPIPEGATLADLLRIVREAPNPFQRAALLRQLADSGTREVAMVALLRDFTKAEHPAVRAAAEYGMTRLFGPNWNRARPIPKPIQPPRSDDDKGA